MPLLQLFKQLSYIELTFPIVPDTSLLFPAALRDVHAPLSLQM